MTQGLFCDFCGVSNHIFKDCPVFRVPIEKVMEVHHLCKTQLSREMDIIHEIAQLEIQIGQLEPPCLTLQTSQESSMLPLMEEHFAVMESQLTMIQTDFNSEMKRIQVAQQIMIPIISEIFPMQTEVVVSDDCAIIPFGEEILEDWINEQDEENFTKGILLFEFKEGANGQRAKRRQWRSAYFYKPPMELNRWYYISFVEIHARIFDKLKRFLSAILFSFILSIHDGGLGGICAQEFDKLLRALTMS